VGVSLSLGSRLFPIEYVILVIPQPKMADDPLYAAITAFRESSLELKATDISLSTLESELSKLILLLQSQQSVELRLQHVLVAGLEPGPVESTAQPISEEATLWRTFAQPTDNHYLWKPCDMESVAARSLAFGYCMLQLDEDTLIDVLKLKAVDGSPAVAFVSPQPGPASSQATRELPERLQAPKDSRSCHAPSLL